MVTWEGQGKQGESFPVCLVLKIEVVHQYLRVAHLLSYLSLSGLVTAGERPAFWRSPSTLSFRPKALLSQQPPKTSLVGSIPGGEHLSNSSLLLW